MPSTRNLVLIAAAAVLVLSLFNTGWLLSILSIIQSVVLITLGIVAIMYLWKRI